MKNLLRNKTLLVTGGAGFIGSHLTDKLLRCGAKVISLDDLSSGNMRNIRVFLINKNFKFIKGDANDLPTLRKIFRLQKIDYIFHYAARVGVQRTFERPLEVLRDVDGIKFILELSVKHKIKKVMFASSSEVYGNPVEIPEKEDGYLNPHMPYGVVKLLGEHFMQSYYKTFGLKTCSLRFFNVYGPRQDSTPYGFVTGIFMNKVLQGGPLVVFGDGMQTRDFVFVEDNINAAFAALLSEKTNGEVMNVGIGRAVTILTLAKKIIGVSGKRDVKIEFRPHRAGDSIRHRNPSVVRMKKLIKYSPEYSLDKGLKATYDWYKETYKA